MHIVVIGESRATSAGTTVWQTITMSTAEMTTDLTSGHVANSTSNMGGTSTLKSNSVVTSTMQLDEYTTTTTTTLETSTAVSSVYEDISTVMGVTQMGM